MPSLCDIPSWYLILALFIASYQGYRGFMFQLILAREANSSRGNHQETNTNQPEWTRKQKIFLLCLADTLLYSGSTLLGFFALFFSYYILKHGSPLTDISVGSWGLLSFLIVFGVLGVCGQLPHLMQQGKLLWKS